MFGPVTLADRPVLGRRAEVCLDRNYSLPRTPYTPISRYPIQMPSTCIYAGIRRSRPVCSTAIPWQPRCESTWSLVTHNDPRVRPWQARLADAFDFAGRSGQDGAA